MLYSATVILNMCDLLWGAVRGFEKRHHLAYCKFVVVATRVHLPEVLEQTCCESTSKTHPRALSKTFSVYVCLFFPFVLSMFLLFSFAFFPSLSLALPLFLHLSLCFSFVLPCSPSHVLQNPDAARSLEVCLFLLIWDGAPGIELHSFRHRSPKNVPGVCARVRVKTEKGKKEKERERRGAENIQNGWGKIKTQLVLPSASFKPSGGPHRHHYLSPVPVPALAKLE